MAVYGFRQTDEATHKAALSQPPEPYPNWGMGDELLAVARYYRLSRDLATLEQATPTLGRYLAVLQRKLTAGSNGLLNKEPQRDRCLKARTPCRESHAGGLARATPELGALISPGFVEGSAPSRCGWSQCPPPATSPSGLSGRTRCRRQRTGSCCACSPA